MLVRAPPLSSKCKYKRNGSIESAFDLNSHNSVIICRYTYRDSVASASPFSLNKKKSCSETPLTYLLSLLFIWPDETREIMKQVLEARLSSSFAWELLLLGPGVSATRKEISRATREAVQINTLSTMLSACHDYLAEFCSRLQPWERKNRRHSHSAVCVQRTHVADRCYSHCTRMCTYICKLAPTP